MKIPLSKDALYVSVSGSDTKFVASFSILTWILSAPGDLELFRAFWKSRLQRQILFFRFHFDKAEKKIKKLSDKLIKINVLSNSFNRFGKVLPLRTGGNFPTALVTCTDMP